LEIVDVKDQVFGQIVNEYGTEAVGRKITEVELKVLNGKFG